MKFDGRDFSKKMYQELAGRIEVLKSKGITPKLVWISMSDDEASGIYGRLKEKAAVNVGIEFEKVVVAVGQNEELRKILLKKTNDENIHGVMVQLPIHGLSNQEVMELLSLIPKDKDVDGLSPENMGRLVAGVDCYLPATVAAISRVISSVMDFPIWNGRNWKYFIDNKPLAGKRAVVVGGGWEVGKGLVSLLSNWGATVIWGRSKEANLSEICQMGDIVISATGNSNLIKKNFIKDGAIVIDVGSPEPEVDEEVELVAQIITPVPGGIGPMTVASLMENVVRAAETQGY